MQKLQYNTKKAFISSAIISLILGVIIFISIHGIKILNPFYVDWILVGEHDLKEQYIAWEFFRKAPWTFPIGLFNSLSYPVYTSVINPDSIPLFAVFFKLFSSFLPKNFQYFGLFGLFCYMLQSLFGMIICRKYTEKTFKGEILAVLGGILFVIIPIITFWMFIYTSLCAHFLLLLCFIPIVYYEELSFKNKIIIYSLAGFLTASIHPYLIAMTGVIVLCGNLYDYILKKRLSSLLIIIVFSATALITLYILGGFSMNAVASTSLYELCVESFNLNGFFNPMYTSDILRELPHFVMQDEGFAYFGFGILVLLLISLVFFIVNFPKYKDNFLDKKLLFCIILTILISMFLALSPQITYNQNILINIKLPIFIYKLWSVLRCTGRFIYTVNYILLILSFIFIVKNFKYNKALFIILYCILLQIYDLHSFFEAKNNYFNYNYRYNYIMKSEKWNEIVKNNPDIKILNIDKIINHYTSDKMTVITYLNLRTDLTKWAIDNNLYVNNFHFSRDIKDADKIYFEKIISPDKSDIFIFLKNKFPKELIKYSPLLYFYEIDDIVISRITPIKGIDKYKIPKESLI